MSLCQMDDGFVVCLLEIGLVPGFVNGFGVVARLVGAGRARIGAAQGFHGALAVRHGGRLADDEENARVADDDGHAGQEERHDEQELLGRVLVAILQDRARAHLFVQSEDAPLAE